MARPSKKTAVREYVLGCAWDRVGSAEWDDLRSRFPETSAETLRLALGGLGVAVEQPFAGVSTKTLLELEASLTAMAAAYPSSREACRAVVILAKDRARFASLNARADSGKRALKAEMVEWMLVWLGDPSMFAAWAGLRKAALRTSGPWSATIL